MADAPREAARQAIQRYLSEQNLQHDATSDGQWVVALSGTAEQIVQVRLQLGDYSLFTSAFFMRAPEENVLDVYRFLLKKNLEMRGAKFGLNEAGDIFIKAELPISAVTEEELDRHLGYLYSYWSESYGTVLKIGWAKYFDGKTERH